MCVYARVSASPMLNSMVDLCQTIWPKLISFQQLYCNAHIHVLNWKRFVHRVTQVNIYLMNWQHCMGMIVLLTSKAHAHWILQWQQRTCLKYVLPVYAMESVSASCFWNTIAVVRVFFSPYSGIDSFQHPCIGKSEQTGNITVLIHFAILSNDEHKAL